MAKKKHTGITVGGCLGAVVAVVVVCSIIVESGAYGAVAPYLGLTPVYSLADIMPGEDSQQSNNLGLNLKLPDSNTDTDAQSGTTTGTDTGTSDDNTRTDTTTDTGSLPAAASSPISIQQALETAKTISTATPHVSGYDREEQFGTWQNSSELCGYGTTRDYILQRDLTNATMDSYCRVQTGTLNDPYTGTTISFQRDQYSNGKKVAGDSSAIQIDHVVALQDAWASGLYKDSRKNDRVTYANDPDVLLASEGTANNVKSMGINLYSEGVAKSNNGKGSTLKWSNSTPSVWLPDNTSYQCDYMAKRVYIKDKYDLTMSSWEKTETVAFLEQCAAN